jgi:hypothetical protein
MTKRTVLMAVLAACFSASPAWSTPPQPTGIKIQSFVLNSSLILEMYNQAQQYNGKVTSYPADLDPAVLSATITNPTNASITPCFVLTVQDNSVNCANDPNGPYMVTSPPITAKTALAPGQTRVFTAADFETTGNYQGNFCDAEKTALNSDFNGIKPGDASAVIAKLLQHQFIVCLREAACSTGGTVGVQFACSPFTLMTPNPGAVESCPVLIYPHNNDVPDSNVNFIWTPAIKSGLSPSDIAYELVISEFMDGAALTSIEIPAGQTYYSYSAKDYVLTPGVQYYYHVIAKDAKSGALIGGQSGNGWCVIKWFRFGAATATGACHYGLTDLDAMVQNRGTADVKAALAGMHPVSLVSPADTFNDQDLCDLLARIDDLKAINVTKK